MPRNLTITLAATLLFLTGFSQQNPGQPLLTLVPPATSGLQFLNSIVETDSLNVYRYEYLYNGHGIGVADFNGDGLQDVFFSGNATPNKLFLNKGALKFDDITTSARVGGNGTWSTGVAIADVNGDGLPDIYVCHSGKYPARQLSNELFINEGLVNGLPVFTDRAQEYGLDAPGTQSTQAAFFDYDLDGDLDMFLLNHSNHSYNPFLNTRRIRATPDFQFGNRLFRNDRATNGKMKFTDVTIGSGIINNALNFGLGIAISDINQDGWPDIYTTSDYTEQDCYYVNNHNGTFTQSLRKSFTHISKYSMGVDVADYNNDGLPDIFTLDMLPEDNYRQKLLKGPDEYDQYHLLLDSGYFHQQMRNMLQLNSGTDEAGNVRFSEIGQLAGVSNTDWSWGGLFADLDNDGWKDLFITNGYLRDYTDLDFLKYTAAEAQLQEAAKGNKDFKTFELVKKMPSNKLTNYVFRNNSDLGFTNMSDRWVVSTPSVSNAAVYADLDNDGDLDLIAGNNNEPVMLYRNNAETAMGVHFLKVQVNGHDANTAGLGTKIKLYANGKVQYQEIYPVRGFQSSVPAMASFGLGTNAAIDSLVVIFPGGTTATLTAVNADQLLILDEKKYKGRVIQVPAASHRFASVPENRGLDFVHKENEFIDFKNEVLLPYQYSRNGPALAKADVNNDGLEDVFFGGAIGQPAGLYLQDRQGSFKPAPAQPWNSNRETEQVNAVFFDADKDGDADLYLVSGGNEYEDNSPEYVDDLYINDGTGVFKILAGVLPSMLHSKQAVAAGDFDKDGDMDLFVGGSCVPGSFPYSGRSYLLRNDTEKGEVRFTDVTEAVNPALLNPGIVTVAAWADFNKDGYPELVLAGDWMPVSLFTNNAGKLVRNNAAEFPNSHGMWSSLSVADLNNDGHLDLVLGNCGDNNQFRPTVKEPMMVFAADYDDNGTIDPLVTYYIKGKSYPMASRDELLDQIPALRKKFVKYKDYAGAGINEIFTKKQLQKTDTFYCYQPASVVMLNDGQDHFRVMPLPSEAQFSRVYGIVVSDFNNDGKQDLLLAGNFFSYRTQLGRADASLGVLLTGNGDGSFRPVPNGEAGLFIDGDTRNMTMLKTATGEQLIVVAKNDGPVQVLKLKGQ